MSKKHISLKRLIQTEVYLRKRIYESIEICLLKNVQILFPILLLKYIFDVVFFARKTADDIEKNSFESVKLEWCSKIYKKGRKIDITKPSFKLFDGTLVSKPKMLSISAKP